MKKGKKKLLLKVARTGDADMNSELQADAEKKELSVQSMASLAEIEPNDKKQIKSIRLRMH